MFPGRAGGAVFLPAAKLVRPPGVIPAGDGVLDAGRAVVARRARSGAGGVGRALGLVEVADVRQEAVRGEVVAGAQAEVALRAVALELPPAAGRRIDRRQGEENVSGVTHYTHAQLEDK